MVVGCVVGLVTPALFVSIGAALLYYRKKATTEDRTGQEWDIDDGGDAEGDGIMAYDDSEPATTVDKLGKSPSLARGNSNAVNNAINF